MDNVELHQALYSSISEGKNDTANKDKKYTFMTLDEVTHFYRSISNNKLLIDRHRNKDNRLYYKEKERLFRKMKRLIILAKLMDEKSQLKPKVVELLKYYDWVYNSFNLYEVRHLDGLFSLRGVNDYIKKELEQLKKYPIQNGVVKPVTNYKN